MPCNCQGNKTRPLVFVYTSPTGEQKIYKTEVEARAAVIRNSGGRVDTRAA